MRCVWDPGNSYFANAVPFPDDYAAVKDYVTHVHIKDAVRDPDGKPQWTVVGDGEIDYEGQLQALIADGYEGYASLETHYRPPSGDTEEGSRACLAGMCRLLRESGAWDGVA
jgi:sugar phosphate isomerase/epimerase